MDYERKFCAMFVYLSSEVPKLTKLTFCEDYLLGVAHKLGLWSASLSRVSLSHADLYSLHHGDFVVHWRLQHSQVAATRNDHCNDVHWPGVL